MLLELITQFKTNPVLLYDFNTPFFLRVRSSKQKKEISELIDILHLIDLTDIYRILHPNTKEYPLYPEAQTNFSKTDCMLVHTDRRTHKMLTNSEKNWNNTLINSLNPPIRAQETLWKRRSKDSKRQRTLMNPRKQCFLDTAGLMHIWTGRDW